MADRPRRNDDPFRWVLNVGATLVGSAVNENGLQDVARAIGEAMNVSAVDIQSYDRDNTCLIEEAAWNRDGLSGAKLAFIGATIPLGASRSFRRVIARRQIEESHVDDPGLTAEERASFLEWGYKTRLDAPMTIGDEVFGVLEATESRFPRRFMTMEHERFELLAGLAAAAIRNAKLFRREQQQSHRLEALLAVSRALVQPADRDEVFVVAASAAAQLLGASWAIVHERAADGMSVVRAAIAGAGGDQSAAQAVAARAALPGSSTLWQATGPVVIDGADPGAEESLRAAMRQGGERTRLCVPLISRGRGVGMLTFSWGDQARAFDEDEFDFAEAMGEQLATALLSERLATAEPGGEPA